MDRLVSRRWIRFALMSVPALVAVLTLGGRAFDATGSLASGGPAPPLHLTDDRGGVFDLASRRGKVTLVYFGYTACPDVCPTTLGDLQRVWPLLGTDRERITEVFITLDPARDTPAVLQDYLANFTPAPLGLTGPPDLIAAAARAWGVTWRKAEGGRFIDHTSVVTVVGPDGRERLRYGFLQLGDPNAIAGDLRRVLHGS